MTKNVVTLNVGSSQIALGVFAVGKQSGLELLDYDVVPLGVEPGRDSDPSAYIASTIRDIMRNHGIKPGHALVSVSGKDIFPRYVKLPPVTRDKIGSIVFYEAQQNVPFAIEEVVWDYQIIEGDEGGQSVMLVAIKKDVVRKLTDSIEAAGVEPDIVDAAPMALYNLARYNYGEVDNCMLVVDMGARSTNLVFIEKKKAFCRNIPIAGHTITQELMKDFELGFKDAEELKISHAFVAFGGVVEGSESQVVNRVSKTVRGVMTRLHAEITRSINFYRGQQNGSKPSLALLCGGSSVIPEMDTFLKEKLGIEVEYLNPFQSIAVSSAISSEAVAGKMHLLCEVAGMGLRKAFTCPMEINLMPEALAAKKKLRSRVPFVIAAAAALALALACWWLVEWRLRVITQKNLRAIEQTLGGFDQVQRNLDAETARMQNVQARADDIMRVIALRTRWLEIMDDLRSSLLDGMWILSIQTVREAGRENTVARLKIDGMGFLDKVRDANAIGEFMNRLRQKRYFSGEFQPEKITTSDVALEFTVTVGLKDPLSF